MGKQGPKASNIYQNPGIANNKGVVEPKLPGVGSPGKWAWLAKAAPMIMSMMGNKGGDKEKGGGGTTIINNPSSEDEKK
jgi:hypothetical protein